MSGRSTGSLSLLPSTLCCSCRRERHILMLGLDGAGKSTILYRLAWGVEKGDPLQVDIFPTSEFSFNVETVQHRGVVLRIWDEAGSRFGSGKISFPDLRRHYYSDMDALVFVVDSNDHDRVALAKNVLHDALQHDEMRKVRVLVLANKQDLPKAESASSLSNKLELAKIQNQWHIQPCSATIGIGLPEALDWLTLTPFQQYISVLWDRCCASTSTLSDRCFWRRKDTNRILILGLDGVGKTTILYQLKLGQVCTVPATIGFHTETIVHRGVSLQMWDEAWHLLGRDSQHIPHVWRHIYKGTRALIFVVDASDSVDRLDVSAQVLHGVMQQEEMRNSVECVLVLANKQDLSQAQSIALLLDQLGLEQLASPWRIQPCSAMTGAGLQEGLDWLVSIFAAPEICQSGQMEFKDQR